jgi:outer membrane protein TolC
MASGDSLNPGIEKMREKENANSVGTLAPVLMALAVMATPGLVRGQVSLATMVDMAQGHSTVVKLAEADVHKADALLAQTHDAYIPTLTIGSTVGYSKGFPTGQPSVANAQLQSLVLSYSERQYARAARTGVKAADLALKEAREQVALDVSTAYIELDTVNIELDAARQQESFTGRLVSIEQERSEAGVDSLSDLLQARLTGAQLRLKRLHLETRAATLAKQLSVLTGMPVGGISTNHASIPEIPAIKADEAPQTTAGIEAANLLAQSKQLQAHGDDLATRRPQIAFGAQYNYDSNELNNYTTYFNNFTPNNVAFGIEFQIPIFDRAQHDKARQSAAEALRATVEAEQARQQNDVQIQSLTGNLRELDAMAEVASLKQQIADEQLKTVLAELELGNGASSGAAAQPQLSPKAEQLARIDQSQKLQDALDAGFDLSKARLSLLKALGHMEDWLNELRSK